MDRYTHDELVGCSYLDVSDLSGRAEKLVALINKSESHASSIEAMCRGGEEWTTQEVLNAIQDINVDEILSQAEDLMVEAQTMENQHYDAMQRLEEFADAMEEAYDNKDFDYVSEYVKEWKKSRALRALKL